MHVRAIAAPLFAILMLAPHDGHAASVTGRLYQSELPRPRPLAHAAVVVLGTRHGAMADEEGRFVITDVPAGTYTLSIRMSGMRPTTRTIDVGEDELRLDDILVDPLVDPVAVGARASVQARDLVATIRSPETLHVGDAPSFEVRIENRGSAPTWLVRSVDGSDSGASPRVTIDITGPEGGFVRPSLLRCGNRNGVAPQDFVEVPSGGKFDPFAGHWWPASITHGKFARPGR